MQERIQRNQILVRTLSIYLPLLKKDGYVLCLQNGIMEYFIAEHFPVNRLLGAVAAGNSIYNPPDTVNISHPVAYTIGAFNSFHNADRTYTDLIEIFSKVPRVKIVPNILSAKWKKLLFSSILNPLSAICGATADKILKNDIAVEVGLKIIDEILQVADCEGVEISKSKLFSPYILKSNNQIPHIIKHGLLHLLAPAIKGMVISMLQDIEAGRETEIDYINGMVKRLADTHNISVPFNVLTIQIVKEIEEKKVLPSFNNLERYRKLLDTV